jgi:Tfp pilus assembly protein PilF
VDKDVAQRARQAMNRSIELLKNQQDSEALQLLDEFLTEATQQNWGEWIRVLSGVAAVVAEHRGDLDAARRYYELRLPYVSDNDCAFAFYNHARWLSVRAKLACR